MVLDEIGVKITGAVASLTRATNFFEGDMPDDPTNCVAIMESAGAAPEHDLGLGVLRTEEAVFQVIVRNSTFSTGRALVIDPKYAKAENNLGYALHGKGDVDGAIAAHRRALEIDPQAPQPANNLLQVLIKKLNAGKQN